MAKAVLTTSASSIYDDLPEVRYHFPQTYLSQAKAAEGDWIVYYEPRRTTGPNSDTGRQAYFATAKLVRIEPDRRLDGHYYAHMEGYLEFDRPVPYKEGANYFEFSLQKRDGSANKGQFGRAVRSIPEDQFALILRAGFARELEQWERDDRAAEPDPPEYEVRPIVQQLVSRKFRDKAFVRHVRVAYRNACAVSGLRNVNGGGRPEVQAAHIRPVEEDGPDTIRNGLALTGTLHWMFDRGLIAVSDEHRLLVSSAGVPKDVASLVSADRPLHLPSRQDWRPHKTYLSWHRTMRFKA
jgi:putative restriction endonuclease